MIIVSVKGASFAELAARASAARDEGDMLELRLDAPGAADGALAFEASELRALIERLQKPVLAALNDAAAFGDFRGGSALRMRILQAADTAGAAWIDVPLADAGCAGAWRARRVLSAHVPASQADAAAARLVAASGPGDMLKLVPHAESGDEALQALRILRGHDWRGRERIVYASGAEGSFTRVVAPAFGSAAVHARAAAAEPTAPGQYSAHELRARRPAALGRSTRCCAVLGDPVAHSWSPRLHMRAIRAAGLDAVFVAVRSARLSTTLPLFDDRWHALALTAPLKQEARQLASTCSALVERAAAANTLLRGADGAWQAHTTDVAGLRRAVLSALGLDPAGHAPSQLSGRRIAVLGSGGAARAALVALEGARLVLLARDARAGEELAARHGARFAYISADATIEADLVLDCTSAGLVGATPLDARRLGAGTLVMGSTYRPSRTPLLAAARARGLQVEDGARWFLEQAVAQFELHHGVAAPRADMEDELRAAMAEEERP